MRTWALLLFFIIVAAFATGQSPVPEFVGVYCLTDGKYNQVQQETAKMGSGAFSSSAKGTIKEISSKLALTQSDSIFIRTTDGQNPNEYEIVFLDVKKKCREYEIGSSGMFQSGSQLSKKNRIEFTAEKVNGNFYRISLGTLKVGEYAIMIPPKNILDSQNMVWTFSIR